MHFILLLQKINLATPQFVDHPFNLFERETDFVHFNPQTW